MPPELLDHQKSGIRRMREEPNLGLFDEPGLGKTAQLLLAAEEPAIVVAPAMVLESGTWDDEIAKFRPGMDITQVSYSSLCVRGPRGRVAKDHNGYPIVEVKPEYRRHYKTKIGDESHYLKGRKTSWTAGFKKIDADATKLATGTPIPNWAHEAFTALQLLFPEESKPGQRFGSYWRWAREWFEVGATLWSPQAVGDLLDGVTWEQFDRENWGDRMLLRLRKDCLDLPPLTESVWKVKMTPAQKRAYKGLRDDFVTWLDSGVEISAWTSGSQVVKLMKCATGLEVLDPSVKGSGKLDALRTILSDRPLPTLVVAHFRDSVEACAQAAVQVGKEPGVVHGGVPSAQRKAVIRAFQRGELDTMCASIETIAEGMTLHQGGADQIVRVERTARPSKNEQVLRRLHRMGVTRPVASIDLVTRDSIDERLSEILQGKTDQQIKALAPAVVRSLAA